MIISVKCRFINRKYTSQRRKKSSCTRAKSAQKERKGKENLFQRISTFSTKCYCSKLLTETDSSMNGNSTKE